MLFAIDVQINSRQILVRGHYGQPTRLQQASRRSRQPTWLRVSEVLALSEYAHPDLLIERISALCCCITKNCSGWGSFLNLQDGCNILHTTLMMIPWYLIINVFIDGLVVIFVRAEDFHWHLIQL